jgi:hypothetical protein
MLTERAKKDMGMVGKIEEETFFSLPITQCMPLI